MSGSVTMETDFLSRHVIGWFQLTIAGYSELRLSFGLQNRTELISFYKN